MYIPTFFESPLYTSGKNSKIMIESKNEPLNDNNSLIPLLTAGLNISAAIRPVKTANMGSIIASKGKWISRG